jgi:probable rRNA maturation factor
MTDSEAVEFSPIAYLQLNGLDLSIAIDTDAEATFIAWLPRLQQGVEACWSHFLTVANEEGVFDILGIDYTQQKASLELTWTGNPRMQQLNRDYRQKDAATDVLSFTLLADSPDLSMWMSLPQVQLGSVFISLDWAIAAQHQPDLNHSSNPRAKDSAVLSLNSMPYPAEALTDALSRYIMERVLHGWLHLHGRHHDTMPDFEKVVRIQRRVLDAALGTRLPTTPMTVE